MRAFISGGLAPLLFTAFCIAAPEPRPKAEAAPQELTNNAPFSGSVYLVYPNGQQVTTQDSNWCPASASKSCSSVNQPSWCCPAEYACVAPANANGLLGCCPNGNTCGGVVNVAQVTTVTVQAYAAPQPTVVVYHNPDPVQGGFCATITMDGPGLPKAEQGSCGTILIVSDGTTLKTWSLGLGLTATLLHLALGKMFHWHR
jgi:hypothetical protein